MNKLEITGKAIELPRTFQTKKGTKGASIKLMNVEASNYGENTVEFDVQAWGSAAEVIATAKLGDEFTVKGSLSERRWTKPETGKEYKFMQVSAQTITRSETQKSTAATAFDVAKTDSGLDEIPF